MSRSHISTQVIRVIRCDVRTQVAPGLRGMGSDPLFEVTMYRWLAPTTDYHQRHIHRESLRARCAQVIIVNNSRARITQGTPVLLKMVGKSPELPYFEYPGTDSSHFSISLLKDTEVHLSSFWSNLTAGRTR